MEATTGVQEVIEKGLDLRQQEKFQESIAACSLGIVKHPFAILLYRHRGHAYLNKGEFARAAADFETGLRLNRDNWDCWYHLGLSYYLLRDYDKAIDVLQQCLQRSTDNDDLYTGTAAWLWSALVRAQRIEEAKAVIASYPWEGHVTDESTGYYERIQVYAGRKDLEETLQQASLLSDHMYATTTYGLAILLELQGNHDEALTIYRTIRDRDDKWYGFAEHAANTRLQELVGEDYEKTT